MFAMKDIEMQRKTWINGLLNALELSLKDDDSTGGPPLRAYYD